MRFLSSLYALYCIKQARTTSINGGENPLIIIYLKNKIRHPELQAGKSMLRWSGGPYHYSHKNNSVSWCLKVSPQLKP